MVSIRSERQRVASGVNDLDLLLDGLFIGDNVVWYDDAGSLSFVFCLNFIQVSQAQNKPLIYVTFDRSPKNLLDNLGPLSENPFLTILDCFTHGKGAGSPIFLKFYETKEAQAPCRIIQVEEPRNIDQFMDVLYGVHATMEGDVRFVFESITGMEELWGSEEHIINFYSHSCPRLYELNTIAYWVMEKSAHSPRLRAQINQIAQVVIELAIKSGSASLTIIKAEKRDLEILHKPHNYWTKDLTISFETEKHTTEPLVAERYEKVVRLGIGTFGETWKVRDVEQEGGSRFHVVKIAHNRKYNAQFRNEAEMCRRLEDHPNAVRIIDVVKDHGRVVLVQEFVLGWPFKKFMEFSLEEGEKDSIAIQLVDIVAHAHQHDIMHRDIKPENIIVQLDGTVKLLDYGVAKELKKKDFSSTVVGSRPFMAPEQIMGKSQIASDVWALGVIMYGLYTEYLPFYHETEKILMDQILKNEPQPPREIEPNITVELEEIILKCLEKDPGERYADAGALKQTLLEKMPHFGRK